MTILPSFAEGHRNLVKNPHIGLIVVIPNGDETVRVNGRALPTTDAKLLASVAIHGNVPQLATIVEIDQAYKHCARPILRGGI